MDYLNNRDLFDESVRSLKEGMLEIEEFFYGNDLEEEMLNFEDNLFEGINNLISSGEFNFKSREQYRKYVEYKYVSQL